jgi:predicted RND superfamily exporter protein
VLSTFCVMIGGIVPWVFSPAQFHHHMGMLLTILLATNVLAGVWIIPAFISWSGPGFITRHEWGREEKLERRIAAASSLAAS